MLIPPRSFHASARSWRVEPSCGLLCVALASNVGCGTASDQPLIRESNADKNMYEGPPFFEQPPPAMDPGMSASGGAGGTFVDVDEPPDDGVVDIPDACITDRGNDELVRHPVDIILLLDNSGSMADELEAVEANINTSFEAVLTNNAVDYRVILISRHRQEPRDESEEASTSICVTTPLSQLPSCENAELPVFSDHFFQYSTKIESTDSFDVALDTYETPFDDSEREEKFDQAPDGWSAWLRPGAKKVFLEMTDDNEDMPIEDFIGGLVAMAPEHFGTDPVNPAFAFHSIIGLAEKPNPTDAYFPDEPVQPETCSGNANEVTNAGEAYQELSRKTGGLRFPLCQFGAYDVVFQKIADDVVQRRAVACDFPIPTPRPGLELDRVAIQYAPGNGAATANFGQARTLADCLPNAFYIANNRLNLCPETCAAVRSNPNATVTALFTCQSQLIVPR
jgi:hypothetical protein